MKLKYRRILNAVACMPWAIQPQRLNEILDVLVLKSLGGEMSKAEIQEYIGVNEKRAESRSQNVSAGGQAIAVLSLRGIIAHRIESVDDISGPGGTSTERFSQRFSRALNDDGVKQIIIDVDSPGGGIEGVPELAEEIYNARGQKPIVAVSNSVASSAAYWIASAADELSVIPSGQVGSIGVFVAHEDISQRLETEGLKMTLVHAGKFKVEGNPFEPLSDEGRADIQKMCDAAYSMFTEAVAKHRGVSVDAVINGFGEGRTVGAEEAAKIGMVDRVETFDQTIQRLRGSGAPPNHSKRAYGFSFA